jgi:DNA-damage-inducible protein D
MSQPLDSTNKALEEKRRITQSGNEYWMARDLQAALGYSTWENFEEVIHRAQMACESAGANPADHFREATKVIAAGKGAQMPRKDYFLARYACYLIAMNGDPRKPEIATAQVYFVVQTRKQELQDQLTGEERRIQLRERVRERNKSLASAAKQAGVQKFAVFQAAGYQGLYDLGLADIKRRKGIGKKDDLLDRAGRTELAANEFRITQTEEKLYRDKVNNEPLAIETHRTVGREVRATIKKIGGTMPENLPAEPSIKTLLNKRKKQIPQA